MPCVSTCRTTYASLLLHDNHHSTYASNQQHQPSAGEGVAVVSGSSRQAAPTPATRSLRGDGGPWPITRQPGTAHHHQQPMPRIIHTHARQPSQRCAAPPRQGVALHHQESSSSSSSNQAERDSRHIGGGQATSSSAWPIHGQPAPACPLSVLSISTSSSVIGRHPPPPARVVRRWVTAGPLSATRPRAMCRAKTGEGEGVRGAATTTGTVRVERGIRVIGGRGEGGTILRE